MREPIVDIQERPKDGMMTIHGEALPTWVGGVSNVRAEKADEAQGVLREYLSQAKLGLAADKMTVKMALRELVAYCLREKMPWVIASTISKMCGNNVGAIGKGVNLKILTEQGIMQDALSNDRGIGGDRLIALKRRLVPIWTNNLKSYLSEIGRLCLVDAEFEKALNIIVSEFLDSYLHADSLQSWHAGDAQAPKWKFYDPRNQYLAS